MNRRMWMSNRTSVGGDPARFPAELGTRAPHDRRSGPRPSPVPNARDAPVRCTRLRDVQPAGMEPSRRTSVAARAAARQGEGAIGADACFWPGEASSDEETLAGESQHPAAASVLARWSTPPCPSCSTHFGASCGGLLFQGVSQKDGMIPVAVYICCLSFLTVQLQEVGGAK